MNSRLHLHHPQGIHPDHARQAHAGDHPGHPDHAAVPAGLLGHQRRAQRPDGRGRPVPVRRVPQAAGCLPGGGLFQAGMHVCSENDIRG